MCLGRGSAPLYCMVVVALVLAQPAATEASSSAAADPLRNFPIRDLLFPPFGAVFGRGLWRSNPRQPVEEPEGGERSDRIGRCQARPSRPVDEHPPDQR